MNELRIALMRIVCACGAGIMLAAPAVLSSAVLVSAPAFAQSSIVREINVVGNKSLEPETVRSYLQFSVGGSYDAGKVDRSIKALFATGLFTDVKIDRDGSTVLVTVVENPIVNQVAFEGNTEVDAATLQAEVQLKPRAVFTRAKAQADVQRILDVYRRQGRFAAAVQPKLIELEQNRVNVVYEITEGGATKVKGISFVGNRAFSDQQLRDIVSTTQVGWFDFHRADDLIAHGARAAERAIESIQEAIDILVPGAATKSSADSAAKTTGEPGAPDIKKA